MPTLTRDEALAAMTQAVEQRFDADELLEIHNEVFPSDAVTAEEVRRTNASPGQRLLAHLRSGLPMEELAELWHLFFTRHRNVWYDEEEDRIHYTEDEEPVWTE